MLTRSFGLFLVVLAVVNAGPFVRERRMTRPLTVVDIPAGAFEPEEDKPKPEAAKIDEIPSPPKDVIELPKEDDAAGIPPPKVVEPASSIEDIDVPNQGQGGNIFGFRYPTVFVIRRPLLRDPFSSFNSFPSFSQFSPFGQGPFGGRPQQRPQVEIPQQAQNPNRNNMMSQMEDVMRRLQQQMSSLWGNLNSPSSIRPFRPVSDIDSSETENSDEKTVLNIDNLPANYSNSTSETKVVDGQVIQVNKTINKFSTGNNTSGFFHFQVINVRPQHPKKPSTEMLPPPVDPIVPEVEETKPNPVVENVPEKVEPISSPTPTAKAPEDPSLNEVDQEDKKTLEDFPYLLNPFGGREELLGAGKKGGGEFGSMESPEYELLSKENVHSKPLDLSGDLRVNKLMERSFDKAHYLRINPDPDVELLDI